jgi:hypothetical protein
MTDTTYKGWTNCATWRVNLEVFDGFDPSEYYGAYDDSDVGALADSLREYAEEVIFDCASVPDGLARDYATAFLDEVNWNELARHKIQEADENNFRR